MADDAMGEDDLRNAISRLTSREFRRLYEGRFAPRDSSARVNIYDFIERMRRTRAEALENGLQESDFGAIMHPNDRRRLERAAEELGGNLIYPPPTNPYINRVLGIPIYVREDIEEGVVYFVASTRPLHVYRVDMVDQELKPRPKPDNSPSIGGQKSDFTGDEPALGGDRRQD